VETKCELVIAKVFRTVCLCSDEKGKLRYLVPALGDLLVINDIQEKPSEGTPRVTMNAHHLHA